MSAKLLRENAEAMRKEHERLAKIHEEGLIKSKQMTEEAEKLQKKLVEMQLDLARRQAEQAALREEQNRLWEQQNRVSVRTINSGKMASDDMDREREEKERHQKRHEEAERRRSEQTDRIKRQAEYDRYIASVWEDLTPMLEEYQADIDALINSKGNVSKTAAIKSRKARIALLSKASEAGISLVTLAFQGNLRMTFTTWDRSFRRASKT
jgi:hypothetical protein